MFKNKTYKWDGEKNLLLRKTRNLGFDDVILTIKERRILKVQDHYNPSKYPNQSVFILNINNYAYIVPFVEKKDEVFFKTIIPSRKFTKIYNLK